MTNPSTPPERRSGPPRWLVPMGLGIIIVLLVALAVALVSQNDDDTSSGDTSAVDTTTVDTTPVDTTPVDTTPVDTTPVDTTPVDTTPQDTTPQDSGPPNPGGVVEATPASDLATGQASIATIDGEEVFDIRAACTATPTVGFQLTSYVLVGQQSGNVWMAEWGQDEGAEGFFLLTEMDGPIAAVLNGQDADTGPYRWSGPGAGVTDPTDRVTLEPSALPEREGTGTPLGSISFSIAPSETIECTTGFVGSTWPFADGEQVTFLDQFDPAIGGSRGFALLAECNGGVLLSDGGILYRFFGEDGAAANADAVFPRTTDLEVWSAGAELDIATQLVEQSGGGGDTQVAIKVFPNSDTSNPAGYLTWVEAPTVAGGLTPDVCSS